MKGIKKGNNKYLFLGIAVLLITVGLYFLISAIPDKSLKIEGEDFNAVSTIKSGKKVTITSSAPSDTKKYAPDNKTLKQLLTNTKGFKLANGKINTLNMYSVHKEKSTGTYVYCIELGVQLTGSNPTSEDSQFWKSLSSFQKEAIELITVYGFPNKKRSGYTNDVQYLATQILIWEVQQGWRKNYKNVNPSTKTLYNIIDGNEELLKVYKDIAKDVNNHETIPSFAATKKSKTSLKTLAYVNKNDYKYSVTLTDSNKVLSDFKITCPSGVSCSQKSNKLTLTSKKAIDTVYVKLTKKIPDGSTQGKLLLDATNAQKMILGASKDINSVTGYVKIDNETLGSIEIIKTSEDNVLKGFKFKVVGPDYDKTLTTDDNGKIKINNLKMGKYTITEIDAPARYVANSSQTITLTTSDTSQTKKFYNELKDTSGVKVRKIDADTGEYVSGVVMQLMLDNTVIESFVTTPSPYIITKTLQYNKTYKVCEVKTPAGYVESKECKSFVVKSAAELKTVDLEFKNEKSKMSIIKVDSNNKPLSGAVLQIYKIDGKTKVGSSWTTDTNPHKIEGLVIGEKYILRELTAPEGYIKSSDIEFVAKHNTTVTMKNILSEVSITKVNDKGNGLSGAVLQVYDSDGKTAVSDEWTSAEGKAQIINGLKVGATYILREKSVPEGYTKAADVKFVVSSTNPTKIVMKNVPTQVVISKTDITGSQELSGAHLQIINSSGVVEYEWVSEAGKSKLIEGLNDGETYTLKETIAPNGYTISEEVLFTVGNQTKVVMKDKLTEVVIYKKDKVSNQVLEGAKLQLIDYEGKVIKEWTSTKSAEKVTGLITGKEYTIRETSAPDKYLKSEDIKFTLSSTEQSKEIVVYNTPIVEVPNTDVDISISSIIIGIVLILGGTGTILWIKKKNA